MILSIIRGLFAGILFLVSLYALIYIQGVIREVPVWIQGLVGGLVGHGSFDLIGKVIIRNK